MNDITNFISILNELEKENKISLNEAVYLRRSLREGLKTSDVENNHQPMKAGESLATQLWYDKQLKELR